MAFSLSAFRTAVQRVASPPLTLATAAPAVSLTSPVAGLPFRPASGTAADLRAWVVAYNAAGRAQQRSAGGITIGSLVSRSRVVEYWWVNTGESFGWNVYFYADGTAKAMQDQRTATGLGARVEDLGTKVDPTTKEGLTNLAIIAATAAPITIAASAGLGAGAALAGAGDSLTVSGAATSAGELAAIDSAAMAASGGAAATSAAASAAGGITLSQVMTGAATAASIGTRLAGGGSQTSPGELDAIDRAAQAASAPKQLDPAMLLLAGGAALVLIVLIVK